MTKPEEWVKLSEKDRKKIAIKLFESTRGNFIISQALMIAMETLIKEKYPEHSNIEDMRILSEQLFPLFSRMRDIENKIK